MRQTVGSTTHYSIISSLQGGWEWHWQGRTEQKPESTFDPSSLTHNYDELRQHATTL